MSKPYKYETNYYIDANGKKHAIAPSIPTTGEQTTTNKPNKTVKEKAHAKPKPEKPVIDYNAIINAFAHSVELRKQEAKALNDENERVMLKIYNATKARKKQEYTDGVDALNVKSDESLRNAYVNSQMSQLNLPQQQSAYGISGGASLSGEMALQKKYQTERQKEEAQRNHGIKSLTESYNAIEEKANATYNSEKQNRFNALNKKLSAMEAELNKQRLAIAKMAK